MDPWVAKVGVKRVGAMVTGVTKHNHSMTGGAILEMDEGRLSWRLQ